MTVALRPSRLCNRYATYVEIIVLHSRSCHPRVRSIPRILSQTRVKQQQVPFRKRDEDFKNIFEPVAQWNVDDLVCGALRELAYAVAGRKTWAGHFSDRLLAETRRRLNLEESDTLAREARVPVKPPGLTEPSS
jgi:hypothetical protein